MDDKDSTAGNLFKAGTLHYRCPQCGKQSGESVPMGLPGTGTILKLCVPCEHAIKGRTNPADGEVRTPV